ncbi:iron-sulfur cluster assembly accessory protein [Staphylococcus aureus]|nr:iron-sulfur cluster assembly accessory protein [Staphylococcus aureus]
MPTVILTEAAAYEVKDMLKANEMPDGYLKIKLNGTTIDFKQSLMGGGFQIDNPNAIASCGCGSSFRTAKVAGNPENC